MAQQIDPRVFDEMLHALKENAANAILAMREGEQLIELGDALEVDALDFLEGAVDLLFSAREHDFNLGIIGQLNFPQCRYPRAMLQAHLSTMQGDLIQASGHYADAIQARPKCHIPYLRQAALLIESRKIDSAIPIYQTAAKLTEGMADELPIQIFLAEQLMNRKRFDEAGEVHDRIVHLHPPIMNDRSFAKSFARAKKKTGAK